MKKPKRCECCGMTVKVIGKTTKQYKPIIKLPELCDSDLQEMHSYYIGGYYNAIEDLKKLNPLVFEGEK